MYPGNQIRNVFTVKKCCAQKFGQNPFGIFRSEEYLQLALSLTDSLTDSLRHTLLLDNLQTYKVDLSNFGTLDLHILTM